MANHLTPDQIARFVELKLSSADILAFDEHLATCEPCRRAISAPKRLQAAYELLRRDLQNQAELRSTHIAYEQLEAYVDDNIGTADREIADSHLEDCQTCRDELEDLWEFRSTLASRENHTHPLPVHTSVDGTDAHPKLFTAPFGSSEVSYKLGRPNAPLTIHAQAEDDRSVPVPQHQSARQNLIHFWRHPGYLAAVSAACAMVAAAAWFLPELHHTEAPTYENANHGSQVQPESQAHTYQMAPGIKATQQELHPPAQLNALIREAGTLLGASPHEVSFVLLTPVGTFVEDVKPLFRWLPLSGASRYQVTVVDSKLRQVLQSPAISETNWKAGSALQRGKVYQWQVTAFRSSEQIVAPAPPAPEAMFEIIEQSQADELVQLKLTQSSNHFALGCAYANAGVLDQAESELRLVPLSDTNHDLAQRFLSDLQALRNPKKVIQ
jgi:anti-sigma factor RsiW